MIQKIIDWFIRKVMKHSDHWHCEEFDLYVPIRVSCKEIRDEECPKSCIILQREKYDEQIRRTEFLMSMDEYADR